MSFPGPSTDGADSFCLELAEWLLPPNFNWPGFRSKNQRYRKIGSRDWLTLFVLRVYAEGADSILRLLQTFAEILPRMTLKQRVKSYKSPGNLIEPRDYLLVSNCLRIFRYNRRLPPNITREMCVLAMRVGLIHAVQAMAKVGVQPVNEAHFLAYCTEVLLLGWTHVLHFLALHPSACATVWEEERAHEGLTPLLLYLNANGHGDNNTRLIGTIVKLFDIHTARLPETDGHTHLDGIMCTSCPPDNLSRVERAARYHKGLQEFVPVWVDPKWARRGCVSCGRLSTSEADFNMFKACPCGVQYCSSA